jgi:hypothetical protein
MLIKRRTKKILLKKKRLKLISKLKVPTLQL